jgi:hypothetical protein
MPSDRENWQFKVKEGSRNGMLVLCPEAKREPSGDRRGKRPPTLLDRWKIHFVLPNGTDVDDARRIAALLNEWVLEVHCTARPGD